MQKPKPPISLRLTREEELKIQAYMDQHGVNRSQAIHALLAIGSNASERTSLWMPDTPVVVR